jgi:hypothetical protein
VQRSLRRGAQLGHANFLIASDFDSIEARSKAAADRGEKFRLHQMKQTDVLIAEASHSPSPDLSAMVVIFFGGAISTNVSRCVETLLTGLETLAVGGGAYFTLATEWPLRRGLRRRARRSR